VTDEADFIIAETNRDSLFAQVQAFLDHQP